MLYTKQKHYEPKSGLCYRKNHYCMAQWSVLARKPIPITKILMRCELPAMLLAYWLIKVEGVGRWEARLSGVSVNTAAALIPPLSRGPQWCAEQLQSLPSVTAVLHTHTNSHQRTMRAMILWRHLSLEGVHAQATKTRQTHTHAHTQARGKAVLTVEMNKGGGPVSFLFFSG